MGSLPGREADGGGDFPDGRNQYVNGTQKAVFGGADMGAAMPDGGRIRPYRRLLLGTQLGHHACIGRLLWTCVVHGFHPARDGR